MSAVLFVFLLFGLIGSLLAVGRWRLAFLAIVVTGFIQDPIRKLLPDQSIFAVMLSSLVMVITFAVAANRSGPVKLKHITFGSVRGAQVIEWYILLVLVQALMTVVRFGSLQVAVIGMIFYLTPLPVIWVASRYVRKQDDIAKFLWLYASLGLLVGFTIYLSGVFDMHSILLEEVGEGLIIYDWVVGKLRAHSGLMRSSEVAAWHLGTSCCVLIILAVSQRQRWLRFFVPVCVTFLLGAAVFTGRRKSLVAVALFVIVYLLLLLHYRQKGAGGALTVASVLGLMIISGSLVLSPESDEASAYLTRGSSVWSDIWERFYTLGVGSIEAGFNRGGFFGLGAGSVSQGAQNFGGAVAARGAAEGGLGKVLVELGVPGLVLLVAVIWNLARSVRRVIGAARQVNPHGLRVYLGLLAVCVANIPIFVGASQVFGDPFVLFVLGSCFGMLFGAPRAILKAAPDLSVQARSESASRLVTVRSG